MNTTFKMLWFEDELAWYNMETFQIKKILKEHYLQPLITHKRGDDFDIKELTGNTYDLILMDFKLADGITGDSIVSAIRQNNVLTDILFYSSDEKGMLNAVREKMPEIDGIYLTKRDYTFFTEKVKKLIDKIVKRSEDVINLRGFVLDNASDFEMRIKEILHQCWEIFDDTQKSSLKNVLFNLLDGKIARDNKVVEKVKSESDSFTYANNEKYLLTITDRLKILEEVLSILTAKDPSLFDDCPSNFKNFYFNKVNVYRNKLGHIRCYENDAILIDGKNVNINQDLHRLLRKNIEEVDEKIHIIEDYLTAINKMSYPEKL